MVFGYSGRLISPNHSDLHRRTTFTVYLKTALLDSTLHGSHGFPPFQIYLISKTIMKPRYVTIYKFIFVVQKINENHFGLVIRTKIVLSALSPCDPQNVSDRRTDRLVINTHMAPRVFLTRDSMNMCSIKISACFCRQNVF